MPIYEYEPEGHDCLICEGRTSFIQGIKEEPFKYCPTCGMEVRRVVSRASIKIKNPHLSNQGEGKGFVTWQRAEKGVWEKVSGESGPDYLIGSKEDIAAVDAEKVAPKKVIDLDKS